MTPVNPTDIAAVRAARDAALLDVDSHAAADWKEAALDAVWRTCISRQDFHVDDVWSIGELARTREDRAMGPVMLRAARLGWCEKTDRVRPSVRSHLSGKPVWRSKIYEAVAIPPQREKR